MLCFWFPNVEVMLIDDVFFFKQKTAYEMRISDWSSDVCSSDLKWQAEKDKIHAEAKIKEELDAARGQLEQAQRAGDLAKAGELSYGTIPGLEKQIGRASWRERGCQ